MRRRPEEFYCNECIGYFLTYLREDMSGNYTIQCPNCNHHHYRFVQEGLVTGDRHSLRQPGQVAILIGLKSTYRKTPYHDDPHFRRQQIQLYNPEAQYA